MNPDDEEEERERRLREFMGEGDLSGLEEIRVPPLDLRAENQPPPQSDVVGQAQSPGDAWRARRPPAEREADAAHLAQRLEVDDDTEPPARGPARFVQMEEQRIEAPAIDRRARLASLAADDMTDREMADARGMGLDPRLNAMGSALSAPRAASPDEEIYGEALDSDPVLPGRVRSSGMGSALGDPSVAPPPQADEGRRARMLEHLRARAGAKPPGNAPPDYTGPDAADVPRRLLHNIANAFRAMGGRPANREFRSLGEEARERDQRTQLQKTEQAQTEDARRLADRRMSLSERGVDAQIAENEADRADRREARTAQERMQERAAELRASGRSETEALALARRETLAEEMTSRRALRDPASAESQAARATLMAELDTAREATGFAPPENVRAFLQNASGEQVARYRETLTDQGILRPFTHRRGGARGQGGGANPNAVPRAQWGSEQDPLYRAAVENGVPPEVAAIQTGNAGERSRLARTLTSGSITSERQQAGRLEADTRNLGRDLDDQRRATAAAEHANGLIETASDAELRAAFMGGAIGDLAPARIQNLRSATNALQAEVLRERSGATVSDPEFERTRREIGTMPTTNPAVIRQWVQRALGGYRDMRGRIRARYNDDVVGAYEQRLRREGVDVGSTRGEGRQAQGGEQPARVPYRLRPNGPIVWGPPDGLEALRRRHPEAEAVNAPR